MLPLATGNLELLTQLISQATYRDTQAIELRRIVAEVARLAGWVVFDAGHADKADRFWRIAISAAHEANDRDYSAYAMAFLAFHAIDAQRDPAAAAVRLRAPVSSTRLATTCIGLRSSPTVAVDVLDVEGEDLRGPCRFS